MAVKTSRCRGCDREVLFVKDEEGKTQILDVVAPVFEPASFRGYEGGHEDDAETPREFLGELAPGSLVVRRAPTAMVSHFATCPKADQFSKGRRG